MSEAGKVPARFTDAIERLDGDVGLLCDMAAITSEDLPEVKAQAESAIESGDCDQAVGGLHKLKGMLSTFESEGVTLEIQEMLDLARKGKIDQVQRGYDQHRSDIEQLIGQIEWLASRSKV